MDKPHSIGEGALFQIVGPDEANLVWIICCEQDGISRHKLGSAAQAADVMLKWLGAVHTSARG